MSEDGGWWDATRGSTDAGMQRGLVGTAGTMQALTLPGPLPVLLNVFDTASAQVSVFYEGRFLKYSTVLLESLVLKVRRTVPVQTESGRMKASELKYLDRYV